ncbi:MAG: hypothetical protein Fur0022_29610 [Anaerolineales bacterium]
MKPALSSPQMLKSLVLNALRNWHKDTSAYLLEELTAVQVRRAETPHETSHTALRRLTNEVLLGALEALEKQNGPGARLLRTRFLDQVSVAKSAFTFNWSMDQVKKNQAQAISQMAEILWAQEQRLEEERTRLFEIHLPPPTYTRLFGVTQMIARLHPALVTPASPWLVVLVGMGGLGKTALAHTLARRLAKDYGADYVRWVEAAGEGTTPAQTFSNMMIRLADVLGVADGPPPEREKQVRYRLKHTPHLIVIDNLETAADTSYLLEQLHGMAHPSKFLVTTRSFPAPQAGMATYHLSELTQDDATQFLHYHSLEVGLAHLAITQPEDAQRIYEVTGGNPLALKLVTGLVALFPLPQVLADLKQSRPGKIEDLYRHIFWKAWQALPEDAQTLLRAMPLTGASGTLPAHLQGVSGLTENQLWPAIQALVTRSLLEVYGTASTRRYGIHALTRTFLHTEIIHWP